LFSMKLVFLLFLYTSSFVFSQQVLVETFETDVSNIDIEAFELDEIKIINSLDNKFEVQLFYENLNSHIITTKEEFGIFKIGFKTGFIKKPTIFRKFITERIHRASAIVKLPKNKTLLINGTHVDVISKSYQGNIHVYIDKGTVKLNDVYENATVNLFQGNVFASTIKSNLNLISNNGFIKVNDTVYDKKHQKSIKDILKCFNFSSIHGNITVLNKFK